MRDIIYAVIVTISVLVTLQSAHALYLTLYTWNRPPSEASAPEHFQPPRLSFTVMLPARHEESVIQTTVDLVSGGRLTLGLGAGFPFPRTLLLGGARQHTARWPTKKRARSASPLAAFCSFNDVSIRVRRRKPGARQVCPLRTTWPARGCGRRRCQGKPPAGGPRPGH
jgi:hypothetical protein